MQGVVVEWIRRRTVDHKLRGSSPAAALMSFGKILIYTVGHKDGIIIFTPIHGMVLTMIYS